MPASGIFSKFAIVKHKTNDIMKKKSIALLIAAVAMTGSYSLYRTQNKTVLSGIALENVEALASVESSSREAVRCWRNISDIGTKLKTHVTYCGNCTPILARTWSNESQCMN